MMSYLLVQLSPSDIPKANIIWVGRAANSASIFVARPFIISNFTVPTPPSEVNPLLQYEIGSRLSKVIIANLSEGRLADSSMNFDR